MLHIDNLCQFVKLMIDNEEHGVFFPQNGEYSNTSDMVQMIAEVKGHRIIMIPFVGIFIKLLEKVPGKIGGLTIRNIKKERGIMKVLKSNIFVFSNFLV